MKDRIVVFGSFVADITGTAAHFPAPGETVLGETFKIGPGGKGSNQAIAAHRAGGDVTLVTKLGEDPFGRMAKEFYENEGMGTSHLLFDKDAGSGAALIMVNSSTAQNMILVHLGACNHITYEDVEREKELIAQADLLLVQLEMNLEALAHIIEIAAENHTRVILNPAPAQELPDDLLSKIDIVTPNETETEILTGVTVDSLQTAHAAADVFLQKGVKNVVITLGSNGVYVTDGKQEEIIPCIRVNAVDTTGAGDAFNGGFVEALSEGMNLFDAAKFGNCAGALSVTTFGTAPAMPTRIAIDELYKETY